MFFSKELVSKTDPLSLIWLAGTLKGSKKISKKKILSSDIKELSSQVRQPVKSFALRIYGTLLLGVVVIYQKKAQYLLAESNNVMAKVRKFFFEIGDELNKLEERRVATYESITLPKPKNIDLVLTSAMLNESSTLDAEALQRLQQTLENAMLESGFMLDATDKTAKDSMIEVLSGQSMKERQQSFIARKEDITLPDDDDRGMLTRSLKPVEMGEPLNLLLEFDGENLLLSPMAGRQEVPPEEHPDSPFLNGGGIAFNEDIFLQVEPNPPAPPTQTQAAEEVTSSPARSEEKKPKKSTTGKKRKWGETLLDEDTKLNYEAVRAGLEDTSDIVANRQETNVRLSEAKKSLEQLFLGPLNYQLSGPLSEFWLSRASSKAVVQGEVAEREVIQHGGHPEEQNNLMEEDQVFFGGPTLHDEEPPVREDLFFESPEKPRNYEKESVIKQKIDLAEMDELTKLLMVDTQANLDLQPKKKKRTKKNKPQERAFSPIELKNPIFETPASNLPISQFELAIEDVNPQNEAKETATMERKSRRMLHYLKSKMYPPEFTSEGPTPSNLATPPSEPGEEAQAAKKTFSFSSLLGTSTRKTVAAMAFYQVLLLSSKKFIRVKQTKAFGDINIEEGPMFNSV